jgi:hypothetical protein
MVGINSIYMNILILRNLIELDEKYGFMILEIIDFNPINEISID